MILEQCGREVLTGFVFIVFPSGSMLSPSLDMYGLSSLVSNSSMYCKKIRLRFLPPPPYTFGKLVWMLWNWRIPQFCTFQISTIINSFFLYVILSSVLGMGKFFSKCDALSSQ